MKELETLNRNIKMANRGLHSIEDHNFWIRRNGTCPYCHSGSKPVPKAQIVEMPP